MRNHLSRTSAFVAAAAVAVALAGCSTSSPSSTGSAPVPAATPAATPVAATAPAMPPSAHATPRPAPRRSPADRLLAETDLAYVDPGTPVTTSDGWSAVVSPDSSTLTVTDPRGATYAAPLEVARDGSPSRLAGRELSLGQAGSGWLVRYGDEYARLTVFNLRSGALVPATVTGGVPFGDGFTRAGQGYATWLNGNTLRTRVAVGAPGESRYEIYRWELTGPGEGGGQPDSDVVELVPTLDGTFGIDFEHGTARPVLLPADDVRENQPGDPVTYRDGSAADLVPSGGGFDLVITLGGTRYRVPVDGAVTPALDRQQLHLDGTTGYLVRQEGGDSSQLWVYVVRDGRPVAVTPTGALALGGGISEDGSSSRTYSAGDGTALYTEVRAHLGDEHGQVYAWTLEGTDLVPTLLGRY